MTDRAAVSVPETAQLAELGEMAVAEPIIDIPALDRLAGIDDLALLRRLETLSGFDPARLFDEAGRLLPLYQIPDELRQHISAIDVQSIPGIDGGIITKLKFHSSQRATEVLLKHRNLLAPSAKDVLEDIGALLQEARERSTRMRLDREARRALPSGEAEGPAGPLPPGFRDDPPTHQSPS